MKKKIKYLQRLTKAVLQTHDSMEAALEINRKIGTPIALFTKLFIKENKVSLHNLQTVLNSKNLPQEEIVNRLAFFLKDRWERIANIFPYTCFPDSDVTKLCLEVANFLNQQNPSKKVYQYLMPTIQFTEDKTGCLDRTNIDEYTIDELILSENQNALIPPFEVLNRLSTKTDLLLEQITNPFSAEGATRLTPNEQRRIIEFSSTTIELYKTFQTINATKRESVSLGGHIQKLIDAFRAGGEHGGNGGTEQHASEPAHVGLANFLAYWETLPQADKDKTRNLPRSYGEISTYTIAQNLMAASLQHDCVELHANALSDMLNHNDILFQINSTNIEYATIKTLQDRFVRLKHAMMASKKGEAKIEWTTGTLHSLLNALSIEKNFNNLINLAEGTTDKEFNEVCDYFQPINFIKAAQRANDVLKVLQLLQRLPNLLQKTTAACRVEIKNVPWSKENFSELAKILDLTLHSLLNFLNIEKNFNNLINLATGTTDKELNEICDYFQPIELIKATRSANDVIKVLQLLQRLPNLLQETIAACSEEIKHLRWSRDNFSELSQILGVELTPNLINAAQPTIQSETEMFRELIHMLPNEDAVRLIEASPAQTILHAMRGMENLSLSQGPTNSVRQTTRQEMRVQNPEAQNRHVLPGETGNPSRHQAIAESGMGMNTAGGSTRRTQVVSRPNSRAVSSFSFFNEGSNSPRPRSQNQEATPENRRPSQWRMLLTSPLNLF